MCMHGNSSSNVRGLYLGSIALAESGCSYRVGLSEVGQDLAGGRQLLTGCIALLDTVAQDIFH